MAQEPTACPRCGTPNDAGVTSCANCGLTLSAATAPTAALPASDGDRWDVRGLLALGAVAAVVLALGIWQFVRSGDDNLSVVPGTTTTVVDQPFVTTTLVPTPTTSVPLDTAPTTIVGPDTTVVASPTSVGESPLVTLPPSTNRPSTTLPVVTTAPGTSPGAVPGDLGIDSYEMVAPPCDGGYITVVASAVGTDATAEGIEAALESYDDANYLRTDQSCSSLAQNSGGEPIYVIFFGPFATASDACEARADGPTDAYARLLSNDVGPDQSVSCPAPGADE